MTRPRPVLVMMALFLIPLAFAISNAYGQVGKDYLLPPMLIENPNDTQTHASVSRKFTGIPSLAVAGNGRLWAVWYTGPTPGEDRNNYVVVSTSGDQGRTWEEVLAIDPDGPGPVRSYDPELWIDPSGKLWVFWAQAAPVQGTWSLITEGTTAGVWTITTDDPGNNRPAWSEPRRLTDGVMMCKPLVLSDGEWVLPASNWQMTGGSARMVVSTDQGQSWRIRGAVDVPEKVRRYDEHMIIERKDGTLWMLVRTTYGIGESISKDRGKTWSPLIPSRIQHPSARFFISRLNSGNLLLVKHGPIDVQTGRSHLMAYVSKDEGHSWQGGLLLDERVGVSYPDGQQTKDGRIHIIYDYSRIKEQLILMTSFTEDEIMMNSDAVMYEVFRRRRVVSKGGGQ